MYCKTPCSLPNAEKSWKNQQKTLAESGREWGHSIILSHSRSIELESLGLDISLFPGYCDDQTDVSTTVHISQKLIGCCIRKRASILAPIISK